MTTKRIALTGKRGLKGTEKVFETYNKETKCSSCFKKLKTGDQVYVCESKKYIYCECFSSPDSSTCKYGLFKREHEDTVCRLEVLV